MDKKLPDQGGNLEAHSAAVAAAAAAGAGAAVTAAVAVGCVAPVGHT